MSKQLVIVESPTKSKTISKFLGAQYEVRSSYGHVRDLPKSKMGVDTEHDFVPHYIVPADAKKNVAELKKLAAKADIVYYATDEDREGEAIAWHLHELLQTPPERTKRITFHEITKTAISEALEHPRSINQDLVDAQQARRVLDRLVGYELSPFLWKKVARGLSAGRVQSVAVRIIVEREREITAFVPEEYWQIEATLTTPDGQELLTRLHTRLDVTIEKEPVTNTADAEKIVADLRAATYRVANVQAKETHKKPLPPFTTSTLQQDANNRLGYSAKKTMMLAQKLYEGSQIPGVDGGLITYMRTDSTNMSQQFVAQARAYATSEYGAKYVPTEIPVYRSKSKNAQEAHEAIRPTNAELAPQQIKTKLAPDLWRLYNLIWGRAMASQLNPAVLTATTIDVATADNRYGLRATGQVLIFDGWLKAHPLTTKEMLLPTVTTNDVLALREVTPHQKFTQPPARYSDATLVKALEEHGIGRPSTYAPTIGTIISRGYVERQDRRLHPTSLAMVVNDLLVEHFPQIVDLEFTAKLEEELDDIAAGSTPWVPIIRNFYTPFKKNLTEKQETLTRSSAATERILGVHPQTGETVKARFGRFGPFIQLGEGSGDIKPKYAPLAKGVTMDTVTLEQALFYLQLPRTLGTDSEGVEIKANIGRFGPYVQREKEYRSLTALDDPHTITLERALEIMAQPKEARSVIATLGNDSEGHAITVKKGRYGAYVTNGTINATLPKDQTPESLTLEEGLALLTAKASKPARAKRTKKATPDK